MQPITSAFNAQPHQRCMTTQDCSANHVQFPEITGMEISLELTVMGPSPSAPTIRFNCTGALDRGLLLQFHQHSFDIGAGFYR